MAEVIGEKGGVSGQGFHRFFLVFRQGLGFFASISSADF